MYYDNIKTDLNNIHNINLIIIQIYSEFKCLYTCLSNERGWEKFEWKRNMRENVFII